ncbi:MAG: TonB-dependent receptor [Bacteroidia bacterium]
MIFHNKGVFTLGLILISSFIYAQSTKVTGKVFNALNKEPLPEASVQLQGSTIGASTDEKGYFEIDDIVPGLYNFEIRYAGFETFIEYEVRTSSVKPVYFEVGLIPSVLSLGEVVVSDEARTHAVVTPLSVQQIGWSEMQRMPGAALDLSRVIQSYPGVLPKSSFGYNIVIRGGAPNENSYYLDGIKIPAINHFSVQGASGGPNALVNMDFIKGMEMYSSAFPANYPTGLSSLMDIRQRDGRSDRLGSRITLGYSDFGVTLEGPLTKKSNFILSGRTSFSQYLLRAFDVPVLPAYDDIQFRNKWRLDEKNEIIITGIAGFDDYWLNTEAPESDALLYNVGYIPEGNQQVYAYGVNYKHYLDNSFYSFVVSRNGFNSEADKFKNNNRGVEEDRLLKYRSRTKETHVRFEHNIYKGNLEFKYGANFTNHNAFFDIEGYDVTNRQIDAVAFTNNNTYNEYGAFAMASRRLLGNRLGITLGLRTEGANINEATINPLSHISPRLSANYAINEFLSVKSNLGVYYQLPPDIILSYNSYYSTLDNSPLQASATSDYIQSNQAALGFEYRNRKTYRASLEVYYKDYSNYPFLLKDSVSFANAMADFVAVGNQPSAPIAIGRSYGTELFIQQKLKRNYWWMLSYSYNRSEFEDRNGTLKPSSWDGRHFLTINIGKTLKRNWQLGVRWRYSSGTPYTPYDLEASAMIENWDIANKGIFDYSRINDERLPSFHQMDIRIDKNWWFDKWNLNLFFDLQNAYRGTIELIPYLTPERDENWIALINPENANQYLLREIPSDTGRTLYTLGLIAEF